MKKEILFGTFNANKAKEIQALAGNDLKIYCCKDFATLSEIEETGNTLYENALLKAKTYANITGLPCFADDTGLEVEALNGAPGIYSSRYAGANGDAVANMNKLIQELKAFGNKRAMFRTVICYYENDNNIQYFEGCLKGRIITTPKGTMGFGYDPIFIPENDNRTLAELTTAEKNLISHRAKAFAQFISFLKQTI